MPDLSGFAICLPEVGVLIMRTPRMRSRLVNLTKAAHSPINVTRLVMTMVAHFQVSFENDTLRYLFNNNQFDLIATANSGETSYNGRPSWTTS